MKKTRNASNRQLALRDKRAPVPVNSPSPSTRARGSLTSYKWQQKFIQALRKTPSIKHACARARISRSSAYRARDASAEFARRWDDALSEVIDEVERVCFELAWKGDPQLIQFILKSHRPQIYRETNRFEVDTRLVGVLEVPMKETLPP